MIALSYCITDEQGKEQKEHGTYAFPAACYFSNRQTIRVPWHWHDELEFIFVEKGSSLVEYSSEKYEVTAGNGCFINAGVLHALKSGGSPDVSEHSIVFHPRLVGGSMDSVFWQDYILPLITDSSFPGIFLDKSVPWQHETLSLVRTAWEACAGEKTDYEIITRNALSQCIGILRRQKAGRKRESDKQDVRRNERVKTMLKFMQEHFFEPLTIRQIAGSASVSESECMRCFRGIIGASPIAYLKNYRLQCAAKLLKTTDLPVSVIGEQCGFQEMSYFARSFRALYGCTPSFYRKQTVI